MKQIKWYILTIAVMLSCLYGKAQQVTVSAPSHVAAGENFRVAYTFNTREVEEFRMGNVSEGLEVVAGPYVSQQSSYQMVNGHTSSSSSTTFTYTLYAAKSGTYTVAASHGTANGKKVVAKALKVNVSGQARNSGGAPGMHRDDSDEPHMRQAGSSITGNDLFIKVSANKKRVHEQEPVLLTYKVYTQVDLTQLDGKMPDLKGFHIQEVPQPQQKVLHNETVNGKPYKCVTWSQYVMYPQMTGKLEIPSITFKGIVVQQNRNIDPLEAFFNGGSGYVEVHKEIKAPGVSIEVVPLPARPANFSGGVGKFSITGTLDKTEVKAGNPVTLRIVIGGVGNLKLLKEPVVVFPKDFDKYDAKVTDKTKLSQNGVEGNMVYDFLAVPHHQGKYTIPAVEFTYYDTSTNTYRTVKTSPFTLTVIPGDGTTDNTSVDYTAQSDDIHALKLGNPDQLKSDKFFFGSVGYWACLLLPFAVFIALLLFFRKRVIENADIVRKHSNRAGKMATKRLKKAYQLMQARRNGEFYDEVLRALWGYIGYKLNIQVEHLGRENISEQLEKYDVDQNVIEVFMQALDECEFERYAPGDPAGNMNKTFNSARNAIMKIENTINANRKKKNCRHRAGDYSFGVLLLLLSLTVATNAGAVTKQNADVEYQRGNYQQAIKDYELLLKSGASAELFYNLGNAYYRTDNITRAVLNYERAYRLAPTDEDINFNLQLARSKTIDKMPAENEMFFVGWYRAVVFLLSVDAWGKTAIFSIVAALACILAFLFAPQTYIRRIGYFGGLIFFLAFLFCNIFAFLQKGALSNSTGAIAISPTVSVRKTPSRQSAERFVIHEGTRMDITDNSMKGWLYVKFSDGREGWIETNQIEEI